MRYYKYLWIVLLALSIKFWIFKPYIIHSDSMASTLNKGDYIIMNTWEKSLFGNKKTFKKNDIIALRYPLDSGMIKEKSVCVKRCIGMPGEWIKIDADKNIELAKLQYDYIIEDPMNIIDQHQLLKIGVKNIRKTGDKWTLSLDNLQKNKLQKLNSKLKISKLLQKKKHFNPSIFPSDPSLPWNQDFFGPLYVPKSGDSILLNTRNISLYKKIIVDYENHHLEYSTDFYKIDGNILTHYIFDKDYFFVAGDNRHHSFDSRHWGFIPEDHIISSVAIKIINMDKIKIKEYFKSFKEWIRN
tara:strand:+ start:1520 stop:2416 length:897 start_codon:yes stop_codon:yes gene_type:complete